MVKRKIISYTDGDFNSIKKSLVEYAKRYYPDTYQDRSPIPFRYYAPMIKHYIVSLMEDI